MLDVKDVNHSYGREQVLFDLSFSLKEGEVLGFLGPNGAGKSTSMKILTGWLTPDSGTVLFDGQDIAQNAHALRKRLGYMPENIALYPEMTVGEYLGWIARIKKAPNLSGDVAQVAERCGLADRMGTLIRYLSKGYKQRVGLAQAILGPTKLLILDEPTAGLDPTQIRQIRSLIRDLSADKTVILSTHILQEVELTCDRVLVINKGRIVAEDTTERLAGYGRSADRFVLKLGVAPADKAEVLNDLAMVPGVLHVEAQEGVCHGECSFYIETAKDGDHRAALTRHAHEAGRPVLEFTPVKSGLEEAFIHLVADEDAVVAEDTETVDEMTA
jgi:ABC-2 type transport system ATP-binding protein